MWENEQARWVAMYAELEKPLYNVVYRMLWDAGESQDIVQEAFLRCWRKRTGIRPEGLKAVLYRAALNLAINRRRRLRLWRFVGVEAIDEEPTEARTDEAIPRHMREAVDALPHRGPGHVQQRARSSDRSAALAHESDLLPANGRAHHFFAATSFRISMSMTRSANTFLSRRFSASS